MYTSLTTFFSSVVASCVFFILGIFHFFYPIPPSCLLSVTADGVVERIEAHGSVHLPAGKFVQIEWSSMHAEKAVANGNADAPLLGTELFTPTATTTYTYVFEGKKSSVTCSVEVGVSAKAVPVTAVLPVVIKPTPTPAATVTLPKPKPPVVIPPAPVVPTPTMPTPKPTPPSTSVPVGPTTLVVSNIPLLSGGTVKGGKTVPVSYLQITNVGTASAIITGFWVTQTGTAPASTIIGLSTVDDRGGSRGSVGGTEGSSPFTGYVALAPSTAHFEPGQLHLFTIKAQVSSTVSSVLGQTITLVVSKIETTASVEGAFPIRGTTWTISDR